MDLGLAINRADPLTRKLTNRTKMFLRQEDSIIGESWARWVGGAMRVVAFCLAKTRHIFAAMAFIGACDADTRQSHPGRH